MPDITISSLTVRLLDSSADLVQVGFSDPNAPGGLPMLQLDRIEVWAATVNDFGSAIKRAEGLVDITVPLLGATTYYWAMARNRAGFKGPRYPAGGGVPRIGFIVDPYGFSLATGIILRTGHATTSGTSSGATVSVSFPTEISEVQVTPRTAPSGNKLFSAWWEPVNNSSFKIHGATQDGATSAWAAFPVSWRAWGF